MSPEYEARAYRLLRRRLTNVALDERSEECSLRSHSYLNPSQLNSGVRPLPNMSHPSTCRMHRSLAIASIAFLLATSVEGQHPPARVPETGGALYAPAADVTISLLTVGVGSQIWQLFGHSAIWIHDNRFGRDTVFNWGAFDLRSPNFIPRFLKGLLFYQMAGDSLRQVLLDARSWNRTVTAQELNLSDAQKDSVLSAIRINARPENVVYRYDYFIDNCATKPRDILNRALSGQLRAGTDSLNGTTYRSEALRLMQGDRLLALGANIAMGRPSDRPITVWQSMFLPEKLHDWVATRQVRGSSDIPRPLVRNERLLVPAARAPEPARPPSFAWLWIAGAGIASIFAWLGWASRTGRSARTGAALAFSIWSTTIGLLGVILTFLWTATDHRFAYANENVLLFNPLWLILAVTLPMSVTRSQFRLTTARLLSMLLALSAVVLLAHTFGVSRQANLPIIGLALLPTLGLIVAMRQARAA